MSERQFDKYHTRGNQNWREMRARDPRRANAYQQGRYEWILRSAGDVRGKTVLDVGCGGGSLSYLLAKRGAKVTGVEYEEQGLAYARQNLSGAGVTLLQGSAYDLPCDPNTFDVVVSCEVIEHLERPEAMLAEAVRVLKPGGRLILTTPYRLTELPGDPNHVHEYYPQELVTLMQKYFSEVEVKETHHVRWRSIYTWPLGGRPIGKWLINVSMLWFGKNPFLIDYTPRKFDLFTSLLARGIKRA